MNGKTKGTKRKMKRPSGMTLQTTGWKGTRMLGANLISRGTGRGARRARFWRSGGIKNGGRERRCLSGTGGFVTFGVGAAAAVNISQATNTV